VRYRGRGSQPLQRRGEGEGKLSLFRRGKKPLNPPLKGRGKGVCEGERGGQRPPMYSGGPFQRWVLLQPFTRLSGRGEVKERRRERSETDKFFFEKGKGFERQF